MNAHATETSPEVQFADFLDQWGAEWRFEPRWPSSDLGRADFRVWLPTLHTARWRLGRVFYVSVGCPAIASQPVDRDLPSYSVAPWASDWTQTGPGHSGGYVFYDGRGRVKLRVTPRANRHA